MIVTDVLSKFQAEMQLRCSTHINLGYLRSANFFAPDWVYLSLLLLQAEQLCFFNQSVLTTNNSYRQVFRFFSNHLLTENRIFLERAGMKLKLVFQPPDHGSSNLDRTGLVLLKSYKVEVLSSLYKSLIPV